MTQLVALATRFLGRTDGQDLLEYALLMVLIAVVAIATVTTLGTTIETAFWAPIATIAAAI